MGPIRDAETVTTSIEGAWATASPTRHGWEAELNAGSGRLDVPIATQLLVDLSSAVADAGGGSIHWRVAEPTTEHRTIARSAGFTGDRVLWQMRRSLPADLPQPPLELRPFVPHDDDEDWLRVNNAAFAWHPEQGDWDRAQLRERLAEPWVDLDGFLLLPRTAADDRPGGAIDGFCWTKVHANTVPLQGEIFVIAVDPEATGLGLGRRLVLSGLQWLHLRGCEVATLYTESDNAAAVGLYRTLGFDVHHDVRVFSRDVVGQTLTPTSDPMP
jgi:mycothiol synthase